MASKGRTLEFVELNKIKPNPNNPRGPNVRKNDRKFEELRESVAQFGIVVPLVLQEVGNGKYRLIDGERRYHVAKALRLTEVPAIIIHEKLDKDRVWQTMFQIHTNWSQWSPAMQCNALEEMYKALKRKYGADEKRIAQEMVEQTGDDPRTIGNRIQFLRWPTKIKREVYAGKYENPYWHIVEIEDKIIEPARRNLPEYFDVVTPAKVRTLLFRKFQEGLVKAAVQVRRAGIVARTKVPAGERKEAVRILKRLVDEPGYSFEEARDDYLEKYPEASQEAPPSPRAILSLVKKLLDAMEGLNWNSLESAYGRARVSTDELVESMTELQEALDESIEEIEAAAD